MNVSVYVRMYVVLFMSILIDVRFVCSAPRCRCQVSRFVVQGKVTVPRYGIFKRI